MRRKSAAVAAGRRFPVLLDGRVSETKFESEDDWFEYRLERDPRFLRRIEEARSSLRAGRGVRLEELEKD